MLIGGAAEPLYEPASKGIPALLQFREDFAASALHEVAHWCIAGLERRQKVDFGYSYVPPPRSPTTQARFFAAEVRVQALEAHFSRAAGLEFHVSVDDIDGHHDGLREVFEQAVWAADGAVGEWLESTHGVRARRMALALQRASQTTTCDSAPFGG